MVQKLVLDNYSFKMMRDTGTYEGESVSDVCAVLTKNVNLWSFSISSVSTNWVFNWEGFPMVISR